jgi:predicted homoserine dehydrogenase-like protein
MQNKRYPKGRFMGLGVAIGLPLGIPIGIILNMIAFGPAIGLAIGIAAGAFMENKYNPDPLPLTAEEEERRKKIMLALGAFFLLGVMGFAAIYMMVI